MRQRVDDESVKLVDGIASPAVVGEMGGRQQVGVVGDPLRREVLGELQDAELAEPIGIAHRGVEQRRSFDDRHDLLGAGRIETRGERPGTAGRARLTDIAHQRAQQRVPVGVGSHDLDRRQLQHPRRIELAGVGPAAFEGGADLGQRSL